MIAGKTAAQAPNGGIILTSSTFPPGAQATVSGTSFSVDSNDVIVDGSTYSLPSQPAPTPVFIESQSIVRLSKGGLNVGSSTIAPGTQAIISGHIISAGVSNVVVDGRTYSFLPQPTQVLIGSQSVARAPNGGIRIGNSTVASGNIATVLGHPISVGASDVILDGSTYPLATSAGVVLEQAPQGQPKEVELANGAIVTPGGSAATVSGMTASMLPDDSGIAIDSTTIPFANGAKFGLHSRR